jgi:hypothetical protein
MVTAAAAYTAGLRAISVPIVVSFPLQRVRAVAADETGERPLDSAADRDHLEELAHFGGRGELLHL